jgi:probable rRNA maturation factor
MRVAVNQAATIPVDLRALKRCCLKVMRAEGVRSDAVLSVATISEDEMAAMNYRYLSRQGCTDVLAFPLHEESAEGYLLGDVVICPEHVISRSREYGVKRGREVEFVAAHGLLHLLGYEDDDEEGADLMERKLRKILDLLEGEEQ